MLQEAPSPSSLTFAGFYCVASDVHVQRDRAQALEFFEHELSTLIQASPIENIQLSLSATPIMIGLSQISNIPITDHGAVAALSLRTKLHGIRDANHQIEVHTGNWPLLDIQEGAMHQPLGLPPEISSFIGNTQLRILTEVVSVYPDRGLNGKPEALVGVGKSVLSQTLQGVPRAPLKYHGMATVLREQAMREPGFARPWDVRKVNQESAVLSWHHNEVPPELDCGQRILIHPVDAASASESFGWYVVVDSSRVGREEEIVDVFVRWRG
jgi:D-serine deaminase-like pyridoxal phosphate-dependent protein